LARLLGGLEIKKPGGSETGFRLNLFTTDEEEEYAQVLLGLGFVMWCPVPRRLKLALPCRRDRIAGLVAWCYSGSDGPPRTEEEQFPWLDLSVKAVARRAAGVPGVSLLVSPGAQGVASPLGDTGGRQPVLSRGTETAVGPRELSSPRVLLRVSEMWV